MTNAPGAEFVLLLKEKSDGQISVSIRTTSPAIDASSIAEEFGGGGHTQAAGCRVNDADIREAEYKVIKAVKKYQAERLNIINEEEEEEILVEAKQEEQEEVIIKKEEPVKKKETKKKKEKSKFKFKTPIEEVKEEKEIEIKPDITYKFED